MRSIGVSNYEVRHLQEMPAFSQTVPAVNQLEYHPHFRRDDIRKYCKEHGIFFQVSLATFGVFVNDQCLSANNQVLRNSDHFALFSLLSVELSFLSKMQILYLSIILECMRQPCRPSPRWAATRTS